LNAVPAPTRSLSFSFPGPRSLAEITNLPKLQAEPREKIEQLWLEFHSQKVDTVAAVMPGKELKQLRDNASKCPMFVLPVWKEEGHMMLLSQFQDVHFLLTYLEDYKQNPASAQPYLTISTHDELIKSADLGLLRGDFTPHITKAEAQALLEALCYIGQDYSKWVEPFNLRPEEFNFEEYMA
ncbi:unnamed protein product, partial [Chrysoparadoxa australica]